MQKAASELLVLHPTKNKIVECGISVDGTWQRRGYSSMNGCVAALSVDTGKVVDIEIMSSYCPTCRMISKMPRSIESKTFAADHVCHSNFQGSALKMEAVGATRIFQRSIVKRGLKYAHYYGDGDSKGFISVKDTYGKDSVTKYECIGHVQKRVGARLRKLKSKNKKSVWLLPTTLLLSPRVGPEGLWKSKPTQFLIKSNELKNLKFVISPEKTYSVAFRCAAGGGTVFRRKPTFKINNAFY
ncbi:uncharacterized protein TNCV_1871931 [Trichonephila clavipes]|nr:uncharacterized protein TNCV_1871931 [Trichonephila clavipes]